MSITSLSFRSYSPEQLLELCAGANALAAPLQHSWEVKRVPAGLFGLMTLTYLVGVPK